MPEAVLPDEKKSKKKKEEHKLADLIAIAKQK